MILIIDNYDSFIFNVVRYFVELGQVVLVVRNDAIDLAGVEAIAPQAIVLSPDPCDPREAGICVPIIERRRLNNFSLIFYVLTRLKMSWRDFNCINL